MKKRILTVALAAGLLSVGAYVWAGGRNSLTVHNAASTGIVDIALEEYQIKDGKLEEYENGKIVTPGQAVSKIPEITCLEEPCYVRCAVAWDNPEADSVPEVFTITEDDLLGIGTEWTKTGDYWYCTHPLETGDRVQLFRGIHFPEFFTEGVSGQKLDLFVTADAIQAANFTPDFSSDNPWKGAGDIMKSVKTRNGEPADSKSNVDIRITMQGDSGQLITNAEDFFQGFQELMPGDEKETAVTIHNTTKKSYKLWLDFQNPEQESESVELLKKITIEAVNGKKAVYSGSMYEMSGNSNLLGLYKPDGKSTLTVRVHVPSEVNNLLALTEVQSDWIFRTEEVKENVEENEKEAKQENGETGKTPVISDGKGGYAPVYAPKTGDSLYGKFVAAFLTMIVAIVVVLCMPGRRRRRN